MDRFGHRDGALWCEDVPLAALADAVGTPAYVYSAGTIRTHVERIREAFGAFDPLVCFAVKANANLAVLKVALEAGTGFDVVSLGEMRRVQRIGADPETVLFSGVGKTAAEMRAGIEWGLLAFNVESEAEVDRLAAVAAEVGRTAGVGIRVNPDVDARTHRHVATGRRETKFGVEPARAEAMAARIADDPHLELRVVQCHIGSQITDVEPYREAVARTAELAVRLREAHSTVRWLDMGGGFGIYYRDQRVPAFTDYAAAVGPAVEGTGLRLVMEPGRVIVGNAGVLLTRVLYNKASAERRFVIVDAGMNDLIRPSLYDAYHRIWPVVGPPPPPLGTEGDGTPCDVVGPICETGDYLARDRPLPPVERGDLLAVMSAGAYGFTLASNYNDRPRPPEVLVDGDRFAVVRERETLDDLVRLERPDAAWRSVGQESRA